MCWLRIKSFQEFCMKVEIVINFDCDRDNSIILTNFTIFGKKYWNQDFSKILAEIEIYSNFLTKIEIYGDFKMKSRLYGNFDLKRNFSKFCE